MAVVFGKQQDIATTATNTYFGSGSFSLFKKALDGNKPTSCSTTTRANTRTHTRTPVCQPVVNSRCPAVSHLTRSQRQRQICAGPRSRPPRAHSLAHAHKRWSRHCRHCAGRGAPRRLGVSAPAPGPRPHRRNRRRESNVFNKIAIKSDVIASAMRRADPRLHLVITNSQPVISDKAGAPDNQRKCHLFDG